MLENSQNSLQLALNNLPQYEPPDAFWAAIEARLPLLELPVYDAPDTVWAFLEEELDDIKVETQISELATSHSKPEIQDPKLNILRGGIFWKLAVAAAVALVVSAGLWFFTAPNPTQKDIVISSEIVDNKLLKPMTDQDEATFQQVTTFCQTAVVICEKPEFKTLKSELDELNAAREELKNAIGDYAADADLVAELTKIEQERTAVLRHLVEITLN